MIKNRGKWKKYIAGSLILTGLFLVGAYPVSAAALLQGCAQEDELFLYIPEADSDAQASVQIGSSAAVPARIVDMDGTRCGVTTVLLVDNSLSISAAVRPMMLEVIQNLIRGRRADEKMTLYTFDTERYLLAGESADQSALAEAAGQITFVNQDTWLNTVLYQTLEELKNQEEDYKRVIVFSDGSDDNDLGFTSEEVSDLAASTGIRVISVGTRYEGAPGALEEMFSVSRRSGADCFLLDQAEDTSGIADEIEESLPTKAVVAEIPQQCGDGSRKRVRLSILSDSGLQEYLYEVEFPFLASPAQIMTEETENRMETQTGQIQTETLAQTPAGEETSDAGRNKAGRPRNQTITDDAGRLLQTVRAVLRSRFVPALACAGGCIAALFLIRAVLAGKRRASSGEPAEPDDQNRTELFLKEDGDETTLLDTDSAAGMPGISSFSTTLVLKDEGGTFRTLQAEVSDGMMIGRSEDCELTVPDDPTIGRHHCQILVSGEKFYIRDNHSANGTFLNDRAALSDTPIETGDVLEIGRSRFVVRFIREQGSGN